MRFRQVAAHLGIENIVNCLIVALISAALSTCGWTTPADSAIVAIIIHFIGTGILHCFGYSYRGGGKDILSTEPKAGGDSLGTVVTSSSEYSGLGFRDKTHTTWHSPSKVKRL